MLLLPSFQHLFALYDEKGIREQPEPLMRPLPGIQDLRNISLLRRPPAPAIFENFTGRGLRSGLCHLIRNWSWPITWASRTSAFTSNVTPSLRVSVGPQGQCHHQSGCLRTHCLFGRSSWLRDGFAPLQSWRCLLTGDRHHGPSRRVQVWDDQGPVNPRLQGLEGQESSKFWSPCLSGLQYRHQ